ncbi:hypothetical protein ATHL_01720 [Anaerolinea thermolimosa]|uniref:DUF6062 family protein n=1 Tax=Anaerolinea thermolimosa TaxID=229919 RepID=UPI000785A695|nr:DUF6062 family protein [Anaerolinea thermolimosa]GAP06856.1 hypothetical protein ATHL_01720 [Anaerolinea thermolimosa]
MAFALSIVTLEEALEKPGCAICRLEHEAAIRWIDTLLWENTNDPATRKPINNAYGFCPEHTRMLVAIEISNSGPVLGVNIIYSLLAKIVSQDLKKVRSQPQAQTRFSKVLRKWGEKFFQRKISIILQPQQRCPVCEMVEQSGRNILSILFEVIEAKDQKLIEAYQRSNGICLQHLRIGLENYMVRYPKSADFLIQDTINRLDTQQRQMLEYIRKHNWAYRDEKLTPQERIAWLRTLTFFTGYPAEKFNHRIDEF